MPDFAAELSAVSLFAGLDPAELSVLTERAFMRRVARGQVLFTEGEPSDYLYLVRAGRLRVFVVSSHGDELVLSVAGAGATLGELSVLDGEPRSATVEALESSELIALPAEDARALLDRNPAALRAVAVALAGAVRRLSGTAADLVFLDLPRRLAKLLLSEAVELPDGTLESRLAMSQTGVAARLGVTRQSLNRAMSTLVQRNWISVDGATVRLHDAAALRKFASG